MLKLATLTHSLSPLVGCSTDMKNLLYDAITGDQSHFVHSDEVMESWRIVDDLLCTGDHCSINTIPYLYKSGSWGPESKTDSITNWDYPA